MRFVRWHLVNDLCDEGSARGRSRLVSSLDVFEFTPSLDDRCSIGGDWAPKSTENNQFIRSSWKLTWLVFLALWPKDRGSVEIDAVAVLTDRRFGLISFFCGEFSRIARFLSLHVGEVAVQGTALGGFVIQMMCCLPWSGSVDYTSIDQVSVLYLVGFVMRRI